MSATEKHSNMGICHNLSPAGSNNMLNVESTIAHEECWRGAHFSYSGPVFPQQINLPLI